MPHLHGVKELNNADEVATPLRGTLDDHTDAFAVKSADSGAIRHLHG